MVAVSLVLPPGIVGFCARWVVRERTAEWCANVTWGRGVVRMLRALVKERGSLVVWKTPRDYVALQRDDTSVLRNYEATVSIAVRGSAFDANPGEDGILGSREISTHPRTGMAETSVFSSPTGSASWRMAKWLWRGLLGS